MSVGIRLGTFDVTSITQVASSIPRLPPFHLPRPRLAGELLAAEYRLRLLCAPAGFGKTVLMKECARLAPAGTRVVWLDLAGRPCSPEQLLARLCQALGRPVLPGGDSQAALLEVLGDTVQPCWIMLDDYPREFCAELDACLDGLLAQGPDSVGWWVSSRRQPAWKLPRLLLQGDLLEVEAEALALTGEELRGLLQAHRLALSEDTLGDLQASTEGWLAGVCLLLLNADEQALRERLVAGTPLLRDYVSREVLEGLGEELRHALFVLARMPRFSGELCDYVLDGTGNEILPQLKTQQLFIYQIDSCGEWFRLWRPFAQLLQRLPDAVLPTQVHLRACQWFATRGEMREAVEHALWAGQPEVAANYLQRFGQEQLLIGENVSHFLHWRSELPQSLFASTTRLIVLHGWALIICARLDEVDDCLADLAKFFPRPDARRQTQLLAHWQALRGFLARLRGEPEAREHCLQALEVLTDHAWAQRVLCHQTLTQQAMAEGDLDLALLHNGEGMKLARLKGSVLYETMLAVDRVQLLEITGEFERAVGVLDQALLSLRDKVRHSPVLGRLQLVQGQLLAYQGLDEQARAAYQRGRIETEACGDSYAFYGYLGLAELAARSQDYATAYHWLREAERLMQWRHVPEARFRGILQLVTGVAWLHQGELKKARGAFELVAASYEGQAYLAPSGFYELLPRLRRYLAVLDMLEGRPEQAIERLRALIEDSTAAQRLCLACECRFTLAEALLLGRLPVEAEEELRRALAEAARRKLVKPLYELQHRQPQWLARVLPGSPGSSLHERLQQFGRELEDPGLAAEELVLSNRELTVLKLIAQGCSNQEIAEQLFISLHTVKTHARRINTKLGVARRTQAVARAKALALL
ncbi:LuxR C-terminal-related transcriptional regulator [Stutzerimonas azotifigens]|uniref:LuxR C-terminal-related transcriptional regulator n=1 Tax=Stutzerimonas azotifigens TaxID=291995 RepID=UPI000484B891|nr:LuxR C-terminal-related transcriptional regulator [Stutzerimonas azotifigens]